MTNRIVKGNLLHRPIRSVLTTLAVALEVAMILLMLGTADGLIQESTDRKEGTGADILIRPSTSNDAVSSGTAGLAAELIEQLESVPEVQLATGTTISMQANLQTVTGVDLKRFSEMAGGLRYVEGGPLEGPFDVIVDQAYARQQELKPGDTLTVLNRDFRVVGVFEGGKMSRIFVPLETMQQIMGWEGKLSQIYVKLRDPAQTAAVVAKLKQMLPTNPVYSMEEFVSLFVAQARGMANDFIGAIVAIAASVGFLVVLLAMYTAVLERTREIGILKSLGASPAFIIGLFMRETLLLTAAGLLLGAGVAYAGQALIQDRFPLVTVLILRQHLVWALAVTVIGSAVGALYPSVRAARQDPIAAISYD